MKYEVKINLLRRLKKTALLFALTLAVVCVAQLYIAPWADTLTAELASQREISDKIDATQATVETLQTSLTASGKSFENLWQIRAQTITNLGDMASAHNLIIGQLTSESIFPVSDTTNVMALPITVSVQGDMDDIAAYVWELTQGETLVAVQKVSYRTGTTEDFSWMWRTYDENVLLPWWEISAYLDAYLAHQAELIKAGEVAQAPSYELTSDDLMQSNGDPICYLELNIIGTGG